MNAEQVIQKIEADAKAQADQIIQQAQYFERAYQDSDVRPEQIDYIECHATGTHLGDLTELESMDQFFGKSLINLIPQIFDINVNHICASIELVAPNMFTD